MIASIVIALLSACGGGSVEDEAATTGTAQALGLRSQQPTDAARADAASAASAEPGSALKSSPEATRASLTGTGKVTLGPSNAEVVGATRTLSATASLILEGVPEVPPPAAPPALSAGGRLFYVDSRAGDDRNDGRAAAVRATIGGRSFGRSSGPWRSLARLMQSGLGPGDTVVLACGSVWNETLRVPANGTVARPVVVTAPHAGCGSTPRPTIDGSVVIAADAWTHAGGSIWRTTLEAAPLQLLAADGVMVEAHHPNRGHDTTKPQSVFLPLAADSDQVTMGGRPRSTYLVTGPELRLPAGAQLNTDARVRVRTNAWTIEERSITGTAPGRLNLDTHTFYPAVRGWGYYLLGQAWMVDSPGEWHFDSTTRQLHLWPRNSHTPPGRITAATLALGVDLRERRHVTVNGIGITAVGLGIDGRRSQQVTIRNAAISQTTSSGIDFSGTSNNTIESSAVLRTGGDAIRGVTAGLPETNGLTITGCVIRDSGTLVEGDIDLSLPSNSYAAIQAGRKATIRGNTIINTSYIGIRIAAEGLVENNFVFGACSTLDDCGGIYTAGSPNNSIIRKNIVIRTRSGLMGKAVAMAAPQGMGIYLDESANGLTVAQNTVMDATHGIMLHVSSHNVVQGNFLFGNQQSQIAIHVTRNEENPAGDSYQNTVIENLIAPIHSGAVGIHLKSNLASTATLGTFSRNRFMDRASNAVLSSTTPARSRVLTLDEWRQDSTLLVPAVEAGGNWATSMESTASFMTTSGNLIPNPTFEQQAFGWGHWNTTSPRGRLTRETCPAGTCLSYVPGGSSGTITSPLFSIEKGKWYRLSLDVVTETDNQPVQVVVRRSGGASNGYESLSDRGITFLGKTSWKRVSQTFLATKTVNLRDPITGDNGARFDIEGVVNGRSIRFANAELVQLTPDTTSQMTVLLVNSSQSDLQMNCPETGVQSNVCLQLRTLLDSSEVQWPLTVSSSTGAILYAKSPTMNDADFDGVADVQDKCQDTPRNLIVNSSGCEFGRN